MRIDVATQHGKKPMLRILFSLIASMLLFTGTSGAIAQVPPGPVEAKNIYTLGIADKIRVTVFDEPKLSGEFTVSSDGTLSLPLIGSVNVEGDTVESVVSDITARLADGYVRNPRVSVDVLNYRPFYILGEVSRPGEYPFSNGMTAVKAVAVAQGFTYRANQKRVYIKRAGQAVEERVKLTPDLLVQPGDTIRIGERFF